MSRKQKSALIRIIAAALLWVAAEIFKKQGSVSMLLFAAAYIVIGYDVLKSAVMGILHGEIFDEEFLMAVATIGAICLKEYSEAVAVMLFYKVGELFESIAVGKSRKSIAELMKIRPERANVFRNGAECEVSPEEVEKGEIIIVRPGEKIALDGEITEGSASIDVSALTGESAPVYKTAGDKVVSGTVNVNGVIKVRTESVYNESTVSRILELVENSAGKKAKSEKFITRFARYYTPTVVIAAVLLAVVPVFFGMAFSDSVSRALVFLVVSCPCALVVSVPLSFFGGIGAASRHGILIKGSDYLEKFALVDTVALDKTGTITKGSYEVREVYPEGITEDGLIRIAAEIESGSNHPAALAIVKRYGKSAAGVAEEFTEIAGKGVFAMIDGKKYFAGNAKLMEDAGISSVKDEVSGTVVHIAEEGKYLGCIAISDSVKPDSKEAIEALKRLSIRTVMLTGDIDSTAKLVANEVDIDEYYAGLLPEDKVSAVEKLLKNGNKVAFAGDGINDAPVLAIADVGIAMGALGSDAAIESADIVLMDDKLSKLSLARANSKKTMRIVRENIILALAVKLVILILGAFGITGMWMAVFGDVGVLVLAVLNALRTFGIKH